ncbi:MAG: sodium transport system permease protein [Candidatus Azotimanducaceae bacterium]|jgi:sodium transport system permease protein
MSFGVVLKKECLDNIRDRRTIISSFSLAILGPIFFVGIMVFVLERALGENDDGIAFTVVGAQHAPQLMAFLTQKDTDIEHVETEHAVALVKDGDHKLVLVISPDYAERYAQGSRNTLALIHDSSQFSSTRRHLAILRGYISTYSRTIGLLRMQLRGIDPTLSQPIGTQEIDVASPAARALTILSSLPYFLVLVIFMGGFYLAIDTTAGEREHGSLEPLLTQPVSRAQLVLGKIGATAIFGAASLVIFLFSLYFAVPFVPFERIGMALEIGATQLVAMFLISLPLLIFAAGLLTAVASFAKSYKEAQTYLTMVIIVPTLPLIFAQLTNVETSLGIMLVPSLSQATLVADLIKGESIEAIHAATSIVSTLVYGAILSWISIHLYEREQILG